MTNIHRTAAQGFAAAAENYVSGRPDYPAQIVNWLTHDLHLGPGKIVLDLGAGTGKFSARLLETAAAVIAVEPVPAMLDQLTTRFPQVNAKSGSADHLPLGEGSVDAVICAQSFHWFATKAAVHEIRRVLKPGGAFGLVWNVRDDTVKWIAALSAIMKPFEGDAPRYHSQAWRSLFPADGFGPLHETRFSNGHTGHPEQVIVERILSVSFIAALPREQQDLVKAEIHALIANSPQLAGKTEVTFAYETRAFFCNKLV